MTLRCYPQPGKNKSYVVLRAFEDGAPKDAQGDAFYGLVGIEALLDDARENGRKWYYGDNAFFDKCRERYFRFARSAFQPSVVGRGDLTRFEALGIKIDPWRLDGEHVVVVESSAHFLNLCGIGEGWLDTTVQQIKRHTDRPLRVRRWQRDKGSAAAGLVNDLRGAWALVTHMSAAANEATLRGVPAFVTGRCAATPMNAGPLSSLEYPQRHEGRQEWAAWLAGQQWTLEEMRGGLAWRMLHDQA